MPSWTRRCAWLCACLMLVLLPIRGWAHVQMHGSSPPAGGSPVTVAIGGHAGHGPGAWVPSGDPGTVPSAAPCHDASSTMVDDRDAGAPAVCALCDLCHGAAPGTAFDMTPLAYAPPRVALAVRPAGETPPQWFFRPPRI